MKIRKRLFFDLNICFCLFFAQQQTFIIYVLREFFFFREAY